MNVAYVKIAQTQKDAVELDRWNRWLESDTAATPEPGSQPEGKTTLDWMAPASGTPAVARARG